MRDLGQFQTGLSGTTDQSLEALKVSINAMVLENKQQSNEISLLGLTSSMMAALTKESLEYRAEQTRMEAGQSLATGIGSALGGGISIGTHLKGNGAVKAASEKVSVANEYENRINNILNNPNARLLEARAPIEANDAAALQKKIDSDNKVSELQSSDFTDKDMLDRDEDTMKMMTDKELRNLRMKVKDAQRLANEELNTARSNLNNKAYMLNQIGPMLGQFTSAGLQFKKADLIADQAKTDAASTLVGNTFKQMENALNNILSRLNKYAQLAEANDSTQKAIASAATAA